MEQLKKHSLDYLFQETAKDMGLDLATLRVWTIVDGKKEPYELDKPFKLEESGISR